MSNFSGRLWDDRGFHPPETQRPEPQAVGRLINNLGLSRSSKSDQEKAIKRWLASNRPSPRLKKSLVRAGYEALLAESV
ncbi:Uncharacterised protein [Rhodococcus rhodochrous]|jgi:hypothetical protein|uniref:hypothetical protein n=1 Tax=Rhodococcus TaxID=1827 RepID=UPI000A54BF3F|nr:MULTISPECIES: hypothetical protein [Rhodococcus]MCR8692362.1 hypothetical protein [Rhodococcus pyridinivorans]MCD2099412.1 hypothetical protein [Rhodococcus rhodochrous]MCD2123780.1 hypothetical protein [Rhodococcus rhodochrous]MCQ4136387.1 hypothetical protein [Rhodococcus rhodochrous]MDC3726501.1 hypothetical protein [Rhodococcus sp. Rp3]